MNERAIFEAALEIEDPIKRRAFIEKACAGSRDLIKKVEAMMVSHELDQIEIPSGDFADTSEFSAVGTGDNNWAQAVTKGIKEDDSDEVRIDLGFLKPPTKPNSIGSLGHYEILEVLGQGGFGIVFKAFDELLHRLVAIKVMNPQMAATSPPRKRFLREARSAAGVKDDNVVAVYAVVEEPLPYLVMEYIDGQTLHQKLNASGPLEVSEILHLSKQIASGLAAAHGVGLIHRDIKPGNILIEKGAQQRIKITDFGLARSVDDSSMTRTGVISGTPMYMAPEQAMGKSLDHRTDLFSFGSVLYQMSSGRPPFRAESTIAVLRRVADDNPRPLQEIIPELPNWLVAVIDRLLQKNPDDRFQTAQEVVELLGRYQSELQLNGKVTSYVDKKATKLKSAPNKMGSKGSASSTDVGPSRRKIPIAITVAAIGIVALAGMFAIPYWMNSKEPKPIQSVSTGPGQEAKVSPSESWTSFFDGKEMSQWKTTGPFKVQDGLMVASGGGSNAISEKEYGDFELEAEWKIGPIANSGIYYREEATSAIGPGNEYQLLDDAAYADKQPPLMQTGSLYGMIAPTKAASKPIGEWNKTRILCQGTRVEHWLNGEKVLAYDTASSDWKTLLDASKFAGKEKVATKSKGHILLQGHTGDVAFRSIRLREIPASADWNNLAVVPTPTKPPVKVLPPIHGGTSLVPRPEAIAGLKSWGIVRSYPSGPFTGVGKLSDGKWVTSCTGSPGLFIHNDDWKVQQVLLPKPVGDDRDSRGILASQIAPQSGLVAFVNSSYVLCVYDLAREQILWQQPLKWEYDFYSLSFSQSGKWLAFEGNNTLKVFSSEPSGPKLSIDLTVSQGSNPRSLCWSPDDQELWMVGQDHSFYAYSAKDLKRIEEHSLASNKLSAIALSPDLSEVAFISVEGEVKIVRCSDWSAVASWKLEKVKEISECKWSPNQKQIAFSDGNRIEVWDRVTKTKVLDEVGRGKPAWKADSGQVTSLFNHVDSLTLDVLSGKNLPVQFGPMRQRFMSGSIAPDGTNSVGVVDGQVVHFNSSGRPDWRLSIPSGDTAISHRNDRILVQSSWTPEAWKIFRMSDRSELFLLPGRNATWSPDDSTVAMVQQPNLVVLYDSQNGKETQRFEVEKGERVRTSWSPDGRYLAVRVAWEKPVLHVWDTKTKKLTTHRDFPATPSEVNNNYLSPAWRSNNSVLVPFANLVFEVSTAPGALAMAKMKGPNHVAIAHDISKDRTVFSHVSGVSVYDGNGKELFRFPTQSMGTLHWLPDGRRFVSSPYYYYELPARGFDADKREQLGCMFPCLGPDGWLTIGPTGHYQGSEGIESEFRYIAHLADDRFKTYTAAEFAQAFQWKNDPKQATFLDLVETEQLKP